MPQTIWARGDSNRTLRAERDWVGSGPTLKTVIHKGTLVVDSSINELIRRVEGIILSDFRETILMLRRVCADKSSSLVTKTSFTPFGQGDREQRAVLDLWKKEAARSLHE